MSNILYGDDGLRSIRLIFEALITIGFLKNTPPEKFKDVPTVDVYQDDWKAQLNDKDEAWVITPLHYFPGGKRIRRKASRGGTWNNREQKEKDNKQATWCVRKFKFVESTNEQQATNDGTGLQKYTMIEYLPNEDKPQYALCRITVGNKKSAHDKPPSNSHQQPKIMEIDHTDSNNGERGEISLSHESMQIGGNFQNTTGYYNLSDLEMFFARVVQGGELSEFMKHFSKDYIVQVFSRKMDQIPAASPKEHSTEAALRNPRKGSHGTTMKTIMEADVSTQRQKKTKVEIIGLSATIDHEPEFVNSPSRVNRNNGQQIRLLSNNSGYNQMFDSYSSREKGEQSSHHSNYIGTSPSSGATFEQWANPSLDKDTLEGLVLSCSTHHHARYKLDDRPLVETGGRLDQQVFEQNVQAPHNFKPNSTEPMDNQNRIETDPSTSIFAITEGRLDHQEPKLYHNTNGNSKEPVSKNDHLLSCNQNISALGPSTSIFATTDGRLNHQDTDDLFVNLNANSTEGMELSSYNQNTIAPGPSTSNHATTVPETIGSNDIYENLSPINNDTTLDGPYWDENSGDWL